MLSIYPVAILLFTVIALAVPAKHEKRACSPLEIVTARGTTEPQGPGTLDGGSQFINAVKKVIPSTTAYPVKYPASLGSTSPDTGVKDTLRYFETKPKECPEQLYVLSGYSQGGVVMHRAAVKMDKSLLKNRVLAVVTFGDGGQLATKEKPIYNSPVGQIPVWPAELDGKIKFNCVPRDPVCTSGKSSGVTAHISYGLGKYSDDSAKFILELWQKIKGSGYNVLDIFRMSIQRIKIAIPDIFSAVYA